MDNEDLKIMTDTQVILIASLGVRRAVVDPSFVENERYHAVTDEMVRRFEGSFRALSYNEPQATSK